MRLPPTAQTRPTRRGSWTAVLLLAAIPASFAAGAYSFRLGRADAVKTADARLGPRVGGRVAVVHVAVGQRVEPGQVLVTLEAPELTARRDQAKSRLAAARAALQRVASGPLPEEVAEARAAADAAGARLERARAGPAPELQR